MNFTNPDKPDYEDTPKDWLRTTLAFGLACGKLLKEREGVVVKLTNDAKAHFDCNTIIVFSEGGQVIIMPADDNLPDGHLVWMHEEKQ